MEEPNTDAMTAVWQRLERCEAGDSKQLLETEAVLEAERLLETLPGHPRLGLAMAALAHFHWTRFLLMDGQPAEKERDLALIISRKLVLALPALVPPDAFRMIERGTATADLGLESYRAYRRLDLARTTHDLTGFNNALLALTGIVDMMDPDDPDRLEGRCALAEGWRNRFEWTADAKALDRSIELSESIVHDLPERHAQLPGELSNLATSLLLRYQRVRQPADRDRAVAAARQVMLMVDLDHPDGARALSNAANVLMGARRSESTSTADDQRLDADEVLQLARAAVRATAEEHPDMPARLSNLGKELFTQFQQSSEPALLDEAIDVLGRAAQLAPAIHPSLRAIHFILAASFTVLFARSPERGLIDSVIEHYRAALEHPAGPNSFSDAAVRRALAEGLHLRYEMAGALADLEEAVELEQAVDADSED